MEEKWQVIRAKMGGNKRKPTVKEKLDNSGRK